MVLTAAVHCMFSSEHICILKGISESSSSDLVELLNKNVVLEGVHS